MVSVALEARGARVIEMMLNTIQAVTVGDHQRIVAYLNQITEGFNELARILERMYEKNRPAVFFHLLRPYLAGSKNMASAGLPNGLFFDQGNGKGEWLQYSGGSNAQSSLIQTFDIFLGVEHTAMGGPTKTELPKAKLGKTPYIQVCQVTFFGLLFISNQPLMIYCRKCETTCPDPTDASLKCSLETPISVRTR